MAVTIPDALEAQHGETAATDRKVFLALRDHLPEDYLIYWNTALNDRRPTFIVIGPDLGVVVLDVKDWRPESLVGFERAGIEIRQPSGGFSVQNPAEEVRSHAQNVAAALETHPLLVDGQTLRCGLGHGVVLPFFKTNDIITPSRLGHSLREALHSVAVLTEDDLACGNLLEPLRRLVSAAGPEQREPLTAEEIAKIRSALYPELGIRWASGFAVVDIAQERIARMASEGHHVLEAVSGSGKTHALICRARTLRKRHPNWRILVLCYSRILADHLREAIGLDPNLEVLHFHRWGLRTLERAGVDVPLPPITDRSTYWNSTLPQQMLEAFRSGRLAPSRVQAILVDEGQDFPDMWFRALVQAVDPKTNSLFITNDMSQRMSTRTATWFELGVRVQTPKTLEQNYRNSAAVFSAAAAVVRKLESKWKVTPAIADAEVASRWGLKGGFAPDVRRFTDAEAERAAALRWLRERLTGQVAPKDIMVLGLIRPEIAQLEMWLEDAGVPIRLVSGRTMPGVVRLSTIHGAKGLEADYVLLMYGHQLDRLEEVEARRLLYIAMTRARLKLSVSYHGESALITELDGFLNPTTITPWAAGRPAAPTGWLTEAKRAV